jgi:hypothetical protein
MIKQNLNPKYNRTSFKTEMLMSDVCFLGKKMYGYKLENQEGVIVDPPKIQYKGIPVIKSDSSLFSQSLLKKIFEDIVLNSEIKFKDKHQHLIELIKVYRSKFEENIKNYDFNFVSIPTKWGKKENIVNAMKIYNYINDESVFSPGSSGKYLYVKFQNKSKIKLDDIDFNKHDILVIPFKYDIEKLKEIMIKFEIVLNVEKHFGTIFVKACERLVEITKNVNPYEI